MYLKLNFGRFKAKAIFSLLPFFFNLSSNVNLTTVNVSDLAGSTKIAFYINVPVYDVI